ncbi:PREDICTED: uncharacterized protein LOC104730355 isoform X3 [Camelina sativa]|uniref:Uncharacterized protein LOC104730355 isoform X3 n=1 Tax=Camelina sativa TaxID=90675 RepID=A0ABM0UXL3_CAMSA|nr:PREDICTED: uncharacterized protein LOC104730355 isoform X3 [Camelina sativa]
MNRGAGIYAVLVHQFGGHVAGWSSFKLSYPSHLQCSHDKEAEKEGDGSRRGLRASVPCKFSTNTNNLPTELDFERTRGRQIAQETSGKVQYGGGRQPAVLRTFSQRLCIFSPSPLESRKLMQTAACS